MSERAIPQLGDLHLDLVQAIEHELDGGFASTAVAGLDGEVQQRTARPSHRIRIGGLLTGGAADKLAALQTAAATGEELVFAADIATALELQHVVVSGLHAWERAAEPGVFGYALELVESPPLPPPAVVEGLGFGGLDEFGLGDLGFDTDLLGDLQNLAGEVAGAVDKAMDAVGALQALANLGDLGSLDGLLSPLGSVTDGVATAARQLASATTSLGEAFG